MFKALCRPLLDEFIQSGLVYISSGFYSVMFKYVEIRKRVTAVWRVLNAKT